MFYFGFRIADFGFEKRMVALWWEQPTK